MPAKKYKIGLIVANLEDPFSNRVAVGAMRAAEALDANLFIIPVKYIDANFTRDTLDAQYDYQYQAMFSHVSAGNLDYIIVCIGTIAYVSTEERKLEILRRMGDTPILCVAAHEGDYDYLQFNNQTGVKQAITYLIKKSGRKRIAMMLGEPNNTESIERFNTYKATLEENGIPFDPDIVQTSDLSRYCSREASKLIDNHPDLDAIFCVNDDIASTVYKELKKRNIKIGKDIAVVGFDDLPYAKKMEPPLSSIKADAIELGGLAVNKAAAFLDGKPLDIHNIDTEFIPRQSCFGSEEDINTEKYIFSGTFPEAVQRIIEYIFGESVSEYLSENETAALKLELTRFMKFIYKYIWTGNITENKFNFICTQIDNFLNQCYDYTPIIMNLHEIFADSFDFLIKKAPAANRRYLEKLYRYIYEKFSGDIISSIDNLNKKHTNQRHLSNIVVRDTLMFENNLTNAYASILKKIHCLGISTSYLYLIDEPKIYRNREVFPTDVQWQIKAYQWGADTFSVPLSKQRLDSKELFSNQYLPQERRYTYVIADLYSNEYQYGMFLCEMKPKSFQYAEFLTYQISAAVKIIGLLKQQDKILTELHMNNLALESMSQIDELTGVYNRRGFYVAASKFMKLPKNQNKKMIIAFADMDNLKTVNDTYGHAEGDFSLKFIADCMKALFGKSNIIGRVGGDEFVAFEISNNQECIEKIRQRKKHVVNEMNERINKPYRIDFSLGIYECICTNSYDLKEAIDKADDQLYIEKKNRKVK